MASLEIVAFVVGEGAPVALPFASTADRSAGVLLVRLEFATVVVVAVGLRPTVVRLVRERKWH